jgi:protein tyrosine phosphatase (PTP) superfamily phosphohydrolase (DUF442 family)
MSVAFMAHSLPLPFMTLCLGPLVLRPLVSAVAMGILLTACQQGAASRATPTEHVPPPPLGAEKTVAMPGLHNVVTYAPDIVCGGVPEGEEGLHTLAAMGIKTIISVDGATPDVEGAERLGMHYVHLPISYDGVTDKRQHELAQALASLPGPVYMHCHHGKHRSAAALGSAVVLAGKLTPEQALERMAVSGTAKEYTGLWKAVREARPLPASELHADPASFPSVSKVSGMVATMSEIDLVFDLAGRRPRTTRTCSRRRRPRGWQCCSQTSRTTRTASSCPPTISRSCSTRSTRRGSWTAPCRPTT